MKKLILISTLIFLTLFSKLALAQVDPVAYWKFDECSGNITYDSSGYGNDGLITEPNWTTGKYGCALYFTSFVSWVDVGFNETLYPADHNFSVEKWVKVETQPIHNCFDGNSYPPFWNTYYSIVNQTFELTINNGTDSIDILGTTPLNDSIWHHLVMVIDRTEERIYGYVDSVLEINESYILGDVLNNETIYLGYDMTGIIDNERIWHRALSEEEIGNLFLYNSLEAPVIEECTGTCETLTDIGEGIGSLFEGVSLPLVLFIVLLSIPSMVGYILASLGRRIGGKI